MVGRHLGVAGMIMAMVFVSVATAADEETSFLGANDIFKNMDISVLAISALTGSGIDALKQYVATTLEEGFDE